MKGLSSEDFKELIAEVCDAAYNEGVMSRVKIWYFDYQKYREASYATALAKAKLMGRIRDFIYILEALEVSE